MKLPQFSLRELFLLVALVAMGCGWWVDHRLLQRERNQFLDVIGQVGLYWDLKAPRGRTVFHVPEKLRDELGDRIESQ
jgi:hypothetical protein